MIRITNYYFLKLTLRLKNVNEQSSIFVQRRKEIVKKISADVSILNICLEYDITARTANTISQVDIEQLIMFKSENADSEVRKVHTFSNYPLLDQSLKIWFYQTKKYSKITPHG